MNTTQIQEDQEEPWRYIAGEKIIFTLPDDGNGNVCTVLQRLPLPGIVIFVHGVNSDGEWFDEAERGLCAGLNARMARQDSQLCYTGVEAGQMFPVQYIPDLDEDGFLNKKRSVNTFIKPEQHFSPVIRFRWGYKANDEELKTFGPNVWLNERDYWGGGPFANGCSSLPDLWGDGVNDRLFFWLTVQHLNPVHGRDVYAGPPRTYYVHAAQRLAKLIELIRSKQADAPITIVCHSQGNMVAMAAAFLGEHMPEVTDYEGKKGKPIADTYILCNPPYSLRPDGMFIDSWASRTQANTKGEHGRVTSQARIGTLKHFFDILRTRAETEQDPDEIDYWSANRAPKDGSTGYTATTDAQRYGLNGKTKGRAILYCNPADQVISATPVQGIGWLGLSQEQIKAANGTGVFTQRVWAQGYPVGADAKGYYHYWNNHWNSKQAARTKQFWFPESPPSQYSLKQGLSANQNPIAKFLTITSAPVMYLFTAAAKVPVNGNPPENWQIPITGCALPESFLPTAKYQGEESERFDQGHDPSIERCSEDQEELCYREADGTVYRGDSATDAQTRYEERARLRMLARREGKADVQGNVSNEAPGATPDAQWQQWRQEKVSGFMRDSIDQNATDHSTILTNAKNAEKALAYDIAVGCVLLNPDDMEEFRKVADWRLVGELKEGNHPHARFGEYLSKGTLDGVPLHLHKDCKREAMPKTIDDERETKPYKGGER